jgi:hypothetical protein
VRPRRPGRAGHHRHAAGRGLSATRQTAGPTKLPAARTSAPAGGFFVDRRLRATHDGGIEVNGAGKGTTSIFRSWRLWAKRRGASHPGSRPTRPINPDRGGDRCTGLADQGAAADRPRDTRFVALRGSLPRGPAAELSVRPRRRHPSAGARPALPGCEAPEPSASPTGRAPADGADWQAS